MIVEVTKNFSVKIDAIGNHQPYYFKEGGDVIQVGKFRGQETKDKWVFADKYFNNIARAVQWGVEEGLVEGSVSIRGGDDLSVYDLLERLESNTQTLAKIIDSIRK